MITHMYTRASDIEYLIWFLKSFAFSPIGFFKNIINQGVEKLSNHFSLPGLLSSAKSPNNGEYSKVVFVLPIAGRLSTFKRFLDTYESVGLQEDKNCDLLVVIFGNNEDIKEHLELLKQLKSRNIYSQINFIHRQEDFSRGVALDVATRSSYIQDDNIILFIDVDMVFKLETLQRIRMNTIQGKQVYLPIVFSQYDPKRREQQYVSPDEITNDSGYFRQFGFGICSIYKSDIMDESINGFDKDITGWGLEDVKFLEKIVKNGHHQNSFMVNTAEVSEDYNAKASQLRRLSIFRAPDPSLVHIYHDISCDVNLEVAQYNMCLGTKANSLGSTRLMEDLFYDNSENLDFIKEFNRRKEIR